MPVGRSAFDRDVPVLDVSKVTQALAEGLGALRECLQSRRQVADSANFPRFLRLSDERSNHSAKSDREPEQAHEHLGRMALGSLADLNYWRSERRSRPHWSSMAYSIT